MCDSDFCLAGVPQRMTFANHESMFSKPRMDNKTTNPFGQTMKRCWTAAGATFQNYDSEFPDYEQRLSDYDWRFPNLEFSDYVRTKNPATKPKFAWAKNNYETTKLAGVQYAACPVKIAMGQLSSFPSYGSNPPKFTPPRTRRPRFRRRTKTNTDNVPISPAAQASERDSHKQNGVV